MANIDDVNKTNIEDVYKRLKEANKTEMEIETINNRIIASRNNKVVTPSLRSQIRDILVSQNISRDDFRTYHFLDSRVTSIVIRKENEVCVSFAFCHNDDYFSYQIFRTTEEFKRRGILQALKNFLNSKYTYSYKRCEMMNSVFYVIQAFKDHSHSFPGIFKDTKLKIDL